MAEVKFPLRSSGHWILPLVATLFMGCGSVERPNVVFILVDDLGWSDLGCYGSTFYHTPNLDRLAENSIRFTNAYSASPVCSPTRAALMTGRHPVRVGITDWIPGMSAGNHNNFMLNCPEDLHNMPLEEVTMAETFQDQGYKTFFAGKWHLGESEEFWPLSQGFEINKGGNHKGSPTFPGGKGYYAPYGNPCLSDGPEGEYLTDRLTDESIRFIESAGENPFFLYLSFYTVHTPIQGCRDYDKLYLEKQRLLPDSGKIKVREEHDGITRINQTDPKYAAMVHSMDANVGRLLKKLKESGKMENTIVVFTSDNGGLSTTPRAGPTSVVPLRAGKGWCYEGGIRVPLIISYPGLKRPGSISDQPVISMDLYPTLKELAGVEDQTDRLLDGQSLAPYCQNPEKVDNRVLVWHYPHYHGSNWRPGSAIRYNQWKLVEFYEDESVELYDLSVDLEEQYNLSETYPKLADSLYHQLHQRLDELGADYPCSSKSEASTEKPNFVWIISEDNSTHYMELFDPNGIATPQIEKMAEQGITFTRAFSNAPVCSVARSTLISSCYGPRTGAQYHRKSKLVPMPEGVQMFPSYLRGAGYYTSNNQKKDYNYVEPDGVWDESSNKAHWRNRKSGQPFFHQESHGISHESSLHFDASLMESYKPATPLDEVPLFPNHPDTELFRFTAAYYRDKILAVDTIVGSVLSQLEADGLLESTFVFYFGDHGGVLPGSKGYAYETGLHIPLVVRVPEKFRHLVDFKPGEETDGFVSFVDFGPTLLQLAGIEVPVQVDGTPFLGREVTASDLEDREVTYGYADRFDEKYDLVRTVRKGDLKYIRNYQPFNVDGLQNNYRYKCLAFEQWRDLYRMGELNEVQSQFFEPKEAEALYDLKQDPYETTNLASTSAYIEKLDEMRTLLGEWVMGMPDLSFYPENVLRKEAFDHPVEFGLMHREEISELKEIADLSLLPFDQARFGLDIALKSANPIKVYWGLIVCSCFGEEAIDFQATANKLCSHPDLLVRTRAAEFLGLAGMENPVPVITEALRQSEDGMEALLILNSLVLLMDGPLGYEFSLSDDDFKKEVLDEPQVQRRLEYIYSRMGPVKKL